MPIFGLGKKKSAGTATAVVAQPRPKARAALPEPRMLMGDGDEDLVRLRAVAKSRDWPVLREGLAAFSGHDLTSLIGNVCATENLHDWLPQVVGEDSQDALAHAVLGAATVERAWQVRTGKRAQHVSQDQFREFHRILREAEEQLYRSVELDAESVAPWYTLLASGRGLQVGLDVVQRRFEAAVKRSPGHLGAHNQMLQQLCRKWSGSHEQMHAFATEALHGPHGDTLGTLIPVAYREHLGELDDDSPECAFIKSAESRAELQLAAERTIFRPGFAPGRNPYLAANVFSWAFCAAEMWPQARAAFEASKGVVVDWHVYNDAKAGYTRHRTLAYQNS